MIKINRTLEPEFLKDEKFQKEDKHNHDIYTKLFNQNYTLEKAKEANKKAKFNVYRDKRIKSRLEKMCLYKCAYCESTFKHVYYGDIEHFRPKKEISNPINKKEPITPGYYWLANDWNNLFLSCLFCNQAKKQRINKDSTKEVTMGKQNQFPLNQKTLFSKNRNHKGYDLKKDEKNRLLINPCIDDPEEYFVYGEHGEIFPNTKTLKSIRLKRAQTSINVYGLQRHYLVQERYKMKLIIDTKMDTIIESIKEWTKYKDDLVAQRYFKRSFKKHTENLVAFMKPNVAFTGMNRFFIKIFLIDHLKMKTETYNDIIAGFQEKSNDIFQAKDYFPGSV